MITNKIFRYPMLIKEHHLDTFGHVNNAVYLGLLEEARWELLSEHGINLESIHATGIGPIILECQIKFLKELKLRQPIVIESQMIAYEKKVGIMQQNILINGDEVCSQAKITFGIFDIKFRKLILPPEEWRLAIGLV